MFRFVPLLIPDKNIRIKQRRRKVEEIKIESSKKIRYNEREQKGTTKRGFNMTLVATQVKRRRGTNDENDAFAGAEGEITVDLTNRELRVHTGNGKTGGYRIGRNTDRTNCITEAPQDIKLELSNGTLTLKAGSKVYVPNGAGVFNAVTITADVSATRTDNQKCMIYYTPASNTLSVLPLVLGYSGSTAPSGYQFMYWYDTTNNKCKFTNDSGTTWYEGRTLPLGIVSTDGTKISAIDQVFNDFGYAGSTIFILPYIMGLVPSGKNTDGTLKTTIVRPSNVIIRTGMGTNVSNYQAGLNRGYYINYSSNYTLGDDGFLHIPNGTIYNDVVFATYSTGADGRITSFAKKSVFNALDYNNTEYIAHQSMPSAKRFSITATDEGTYTAPADGYFTFFATANTSNGYAGFRRNGLVVSMFSSLINATSGAFEIAVRKGEAITLFYGNVGSPSLYFEYAQGTTNE